MYRTIPRDALERLRKRFAKRCRKPNPITGCIEVRYKLHPCGYPRCWAGGQALNARRVAWLLSGRVAPQGMRIFVLCGNPRCVAVDAGHVVLRPWPAEGRARRKVLKKAAKAGIPASDRTAPR